MLNIKHLRSNSTGITFTSRSIIKYLILFSLISCSTASINNNGPSLCVDKGYYDCSICPTLCNTDPVVETGFDLAFSCLSLVGLVVSIVGIWRIKEMREAPGDIVFGLCVSDAVLSLEWIVQYSTRLSQNNSIDPDGSLCKVASYFDVAFYYLSTFYNFTFFCFFYMATKTSLKITRIPHYVYHVVPIIGTVIAVIITYSKDLFGMSMYGICSFKTSNTYSPQILTLVLYLIFPFIMSYAVKKSLPECKKLSTVRYHFLRYYLTYIFATSLFNAVLSAIGIVLVAGIKEFSDQIQEPSFTRTLSVSIMIGNIVRVIRPITLAIIRLFDPNLRQYWKRIFSFMRDNTSPLKINMLGEMQDEDIDGRQRTVSLTIKEMQRCLRNTPYLQQIQHTMRVQVLYSLLSSIHYFWRISKKSMLHSYVCSAEGFKVDYKKMAKFTEQVMINNDILKREMPEMMREIQIKDYKSIAGVLTVYAPGIFREIIEMEGKNDVMNISLDLSANYSRIIKAGGNNGGKSGEFFFFSYDNSLVIKTISDRELKTLLKVLPKYSQHFKANPSSLIAKIYGVFTFRRVDPHEKYNLILMRNVNGFPSEFVERKYDLKGSTYGRITIKFDNPEKSKLKEYDTLKDIDFLRFEKKMFIEPKLKEGLIKTLRSDCEFLKQNKLIDYSLVVYVLRRYRQSLQRENSQSLGTENSSRENFDAQSLNVVNSFLALETSIHEEARKIQRAKTLTSGDKLNGNQRFHSMRSTEEDVEYHIGIIDYLVKYTLKKKLENYGKKFLACNMNLDISVQSPGYYAERFMSFMEKIIYRNL